MAKYLGQWHVCVELVVDRCSFCGGLLSHGMPNEDSGLNEIE